MNPGAAGRRGGLGDASVGSARGCPRGRLLHAHQVGGRAFRGCGGSALRGCGGSRIWGVECMNRREGFRD